MKAFVIHRYSERGIASKYVKALGAELKVPISYTLLAKSDGDHWKDKALEGIRSSEIVIVFDPEACSSSQNTLWELEQAERLGIKVVEVRKCNENVEAKKIIRDVYNFQDEFDSCFSSPLPEKSNREIELYKLMVETSEQLILRRQKANAFFITIIGSLSAVIGLLIKEGIASQDNIWVLLLLTVPGLVLCNSWRNQLDNYGKLNSGKFDVILRMEKDFPVQIFSAEWIALGKGDRPKKYRSFTATEKHVPVLFGAIFFIFSLGILYVFLQGSSLCFWFFCEANFGLDLDTFGCCP